MRLICTRVLVGLALGASVLCTQVPALAQQQTPPPKDGLLGAIVKSLTGDVYAEPERWRPLFFSGFFTEGWDEAWVSPPAGAGGAPRQGRLNAFDGVFYRLGIATYGYAPTSPTTATRTRAFSSSTCRSTGASSSASISRWRCRTAGRRATTTRRISETSRSCPASSCWPD